MKTSISVLRLPITTSQMLSPSRRCRARESARCREGDFVDGRRSRCELAGSTAVRIASTPPAAVRFTAASRAGTPTDRTPASLATAPRGEGSVQAILERDQGTCTSCGAPATQADHLIPKHRGRRRIQPRRVLPLSRPQDRERRAGSTPAAKRPLQPSPRQLSHRDHCHQRFDRRRHFHSERKASRRAESAPHRRDNAPASWCKRAISGIMQAFSIASPLSLPTI
jgi:hypothetical protein